MPSHLLAAAREARKMGFTVRSSKTPKGHISSYYAHKGGSRLRISDHCLPQTARRDCMAEVHGGATRPELIITEKATATRLRRMIVLAAAGRTI